MSSRVVTFLGYGAILAAIVAWAAISARRPPWMTLPEALVALARTRTMRLVLVAAWIWLGWHLFARGSGAFS
jgi:Family of unknown function (DUF6186)